MSERPAGTYHFEGFGPKAIEWFIGLEQDNSKSYFEANRAIFEEQVREPMLALLMEASTHVDGDVKLFRANRDVRFSKDKSPYKTSTYGVIRPESTDAALYASISAQGFYAASGYYQIANDQLDRLRSAVADDRTGQTGGDDRRQGQGEWLDGRGRVAEDSAEGISQRPSSHRAATDERARLRSENATGGLAARPAGVRLCNGDLDNGRTAECLARCECGGNQLGNTKQVQRIANIFETSACCRAEARPVVGTRQQGSRQQAVGQWEPGSLTRFRVAESEITLPWLRT